MPLAPARTSGCRRDQSCSGTPTSAPITAIGSGSFDSVFLADRLAARYHQPVPFSDGAGVVESVGAGVTRVKVGDRVTPIFMQTWIDGRLDYEAFHLGMMEPSVEAAVAALAAEGLEPDYAIANAYMDYFACAHAQRLPIVSIQWASWREAGLGETRTQAYRNTGLLTQSNAEGLAMLEQVLSLRAAVMVRACSARPARHDEHGRRTASHQR